MSNPNEPYDSDWLKQSETVDEIKEESVEIKEEPFDDMADIEQEDLMYFFSEDFKDETVEIKEEAEDFTGVKQEEPIPDIFKANDNESVEIKEEPIDDFVDIKEEEFSTLPITDVFCPSTGVSRPLTINIDKGMHSTSQIASPRPTMMKATKTISVKGPIRVTRDAIIKLDRNVPSFSPSTINAVATSTDPIAPKRPCINQNGTSTIASCTTYPYLDPNSDEIEEHILLWHPERLGVPQKCYFCDGYFSRGDEMNNHVRSMHTDWSVRRGRKSKDEQLATANGLPISAAEIADLTPLDFKNLLKADSLSESQRQVIRKIRKRGKNKISARAYRERRDLARTENERRGEQSAPCRSID